MDTSFALWLEKRVDTTDSSVDITNPTNTPPVSREPYYNKPAPFLGQMAPGTLRPIEDIIKKWPQIRLVDVTGQKEHDWVIEPEPKKAGTYDYNNGILAVIDQRGHVWVTGDVDNSLYHELKRGGYFPGHVGVPFSNDVSLPDMPRNRNRPVQQDDTPAYVARANQDRARLFWQKFSQAGRTGSSPPPGYFNRA